MIEIVLNTYTYVINDIRYIRKQNIFFIISLTTIHIIISMYINCVLYSHLVNT